MRLRFAPCAGTLALDGARTLASQSVAEYTSARFTPRSDDIGGLAVHLLLRACEFANSDEVLVTRNVRELAVGSGLVMHDRGHAHPERRSAPPIAMIGSVKRVFLRHAFWAVDASVVPYC